MSWLKAECEAMPVTHLEPLKLCTPTVTSTNASVTMPISSGSSSRPWGRGAS